MKPMKTMRTIKNPETYIKDIDDTLGYASDITVEHRSNNPKRDFLFVNKKQCKQTNKSTYTAIIKYYKINKDKKLSAVNRRLKVWQ